MLAGGNLKTPNIMVKMCHTNVGNNHINKTRVNDKGVAPDRCFLDQQQRPCYLR